MRTDLQPRHPYEGFCVVVKNNWADWSKIHALCVFTAIGRDTEVSNTDGSLFQTKYCHTGFAQSNN